MINWNCVSLFCSCFRNFSLFILVTAATSTVSFELDCDGLTTFVLCSFIGSHSLYTINIIIIEQNENDKMPLNGIDCNV